jgi:hypothetical protein
LDVPVCLGFGVTSLSTLPAYAPPGRETQVIFDLTEAGANFVRAWVTVAPPGSELRANLEKSTQSRVQIYQGDGGENASLRRKFDKGGKYTIVCQEYQRGAAAYGGGYQGAPDGAPSETKLGAETTLTLFIGQRMTAELGANGDTATLVLWVWDQTIRATSLGVHGEVSPALKSDSPTPRARAAIESAAVTGALSGLAGQTVATLTGDPGAVLEDFLTVWSGHLADGISHAAADTYNGLAAGLAGAPSVASLKEAITEILPNIRYHYTNDAQRGNVVNGRDSAGFHNVVGKKNDNANLPLLAGVGDADAYWALAELHRSYEAHRASAVHVTPDVTHVLDPLPPLLTLASLFFEVLASTTPVTPPAQSTGAQQLISRASFAETPL